MSDSKVQAKARPAANRTARRPNELAQLRGKRLSFSCEVEDGVGWGKSRRKELSAEPMVRIVRGGLL